MATVYTDNTTTSISINILSLIQVYIFTSTLVWQNTAKMYKLDLPVDYKEAAAIERRKNMEEQRKSRIFNAKTRTIGVSTGFFSILPSGIQFFLF